MGTKRAIGLDNGESHLTHLLFMTGTQLLVFLGLERACWQWALKMEGYKLTCYDGKPHACFYYD